MGRKRSKSDGLPYRLYERRGVHVYSIGYKTVEGTWAFRLKCRVNDRVRVAECRREAIQRAAALHAGGPDAGPWTFAVLCDKWVERQRALPANAEEKRARSTLEENIREIATLKKAFAPMPISDITKADAYAYLDACLVAVDAQGRPRPRPEKGNKEIALARTLFEFAIRSQQIALNPFARVKKLRVRKPPARYVTHDELARAVRVACEMGGAYYIMGLCLQTAYLCYRRSFEARHLTRDMLNDEGILWTPLRKGRSKLPVKQVQIEWTPEVRATIHEALNCPRRKGAATLFIFGNLAGRPYTKGGWKANLSRLMHQCMQDAAERGEVFEPFSLQECRPKAVSDELDENGGDVKPVMNATQHTDERMIRSNYDRRKIVRATAVGASRITKLEYPRTKGVSP
jgi:site-specific recombinase XerD